MVRGVQPRVGIVKQAGKRERWGVALAITVTFVLSVAGAAAAAKKRSRWALG